MTTHHTQPITCPECKGTGDNPEHNWLQCGWCMGMGVMHVTIPNAPALYREPQDEPPGRDLDGGP